MNLYETYFDPECVEKPYRDDKEAVDDILSLIDCFVMAAFNGKDVVGERMDMRGIVITPKEVEDALEERSRFRQQESGVRAAMSESLNKALYHLWHRMDKSLEIRIWKLTQTLELNEQEWFVFCLSLVCDYDRKYERLFGYLQDNVSVKLPTLGLAEALWSLAKGEAISIPEDSFLWKHLVCREDSRSSGCSRLSVELYVYSAPAGYLRGYGDSYAWSSDRATALKPGAVYVKPVYEWDDLILEEEQKGLMRQMCSHITYRTKVRDDWGFGQKSPYGNGVSALFFGPPGTGKTMAAQVIAKELGMDLYKVDLSQLVSKYIGETEKNLSSLFEKAAQNQAALLFDEADSLFAKRSQVNNSNDRYANMETGFLLQKFEEYEGVSILATNFVNNMDDAFRRRIKFMIKFTMPKEEDRQKLWKSMIPEKAQLKEELYLEGYARCFDMPGSGIREVATNAAYLAASDGTGIGNRHIKEALRMYYLKSGRHLTQKELDHSQFHF